MKVCSIFRHTFFILVLLQIMVEKIFILSTIISGRAFIFSNDKKRLFFTKPIKKPPFKSYIIVL